MTIFDNHTGVDLTALADAVFRFDNGTTVIEEVKAESGKVKAIYDLQGRKVDTPSKGIYIINGKKIFVK